MLARTKSTQSNSLLGRPKKSKKQTMLDEKSSEWFKKSSELMYKTVTYTKKENQGIKLKTIYKKDNIYSFTKIDGAKIQYTLIVKKIKDDNTIPDGSLIVAINSTDLSNNYMGKGYEKFLSVYKSINSGEKFTIKYRLINPNLPVPYKLPSQLKLQRATPKVTLASKNLPRVIRNKEDLDMTSLHLPGQKEGCYNDQYCISNGWGDYCNNLTGDCEYSYEEIELTRTGVGAMKKNKSKRKDKTKGKNKSKGKNKY